MYNKNVIITIRNYNNHVYKCIAEIKKACITGNLFNT